MPNLELTQIAAAHGFSPDTLPDNRQKRLHPLQREALLASASSSRSFGYGLAVIAVLLPVAAAVFGSRRAAAMHHASFLTGPLILSLLAAAGPAILAFVLVRTGSNLARRVEAGVVDVYSGSVKKVVFANRRGKRYTYVLPDVVVDVSKAAFDQVTDGRAYRLYLLAGEPVTKERVTLLGIEPS